MLGLMLAACSPPGHTFSQLYLPTPAGAHGHSIRPRLAGAGAVLVVQCFDTTFLNHSKNGFQFTSSAFLLVDQIAVYIVLGTPCPLFPTQPPALSAAG